MANLHQVIYALSDALDLVGVDDIYHGKRVAYMALEVASELSLRKDDYIDILHASLLHDCGVSSSRIHDKLVFTLDWEGAEDHCIRGYQLLNLSKELKHLSNIVLYHHTHYDTLQALKIDFRTANLANLIFLVDRVDALTAQHRVKEKASLISISESVRSEIKNLSDTFFDPKLVEAFLKVSKKESFWFTLEEENLHRFFENYFEGLGDINVGLTELEDVAKLFALFVDAKSPYTADHSLDVAELSKFIALKMDLDFNTSEMIKIAGLLHDLGKLKVPDELIEKNGPLSHDEYNIVKIHAYETHQILSKIKGLEDITQWASQHHENLRGTGYPYHQEKDELPLPSRIIGASDIFQALAQDRPYRQGLKPLQILKVLKEKVDNGELDEMVVNTIEKNIQQCWEISIKHSSKQQKEYL
jgi:putative nucleotidyltransferase with HDIG domain